MKKEQRMLGDDKNWEHVFITQRLVLTDITTKKFLLVKYAVGLSLEADSNPWGFVGGHLEEKEELLDSLYREAAEEAGNIEYDVIEVLDVARHKDVTLSIPYLALYKGGDIVLSEEHTEFAWMSADEIIQNTKIGPRVKEIIQLAVERLKEREYLPDLKRMQADFSNYKKRQQESQKELAGYLIEKLVMEITPILDNFHMATQHVPADSCNTPWVMGISYIEKQLEKVLSDNGMQVIDAKEGDVFDPRMHEAISEEEKVATEGEDAPIENEAPQQQTIAKVLQKGYKIGEKVIRPTKAVVR